MKKDKIMEFLKDSNITDDDVKSAREFLGKYKNKQEGKTKDELIKELKKMKASMDKRTFEKQMKALNKVRDLLNDKQKKRLDKLMEILNEDE